MKVSIFIFSLITLSCVYCQEIITTPLSDRIKNENENEFIRVRLEFDKNIDCFYLNQKFKENKTKLHERAKTVISKLQNQAQKSQSEILDFLKHNKFARNIKNFWIVNIIILEIRKDKIEELKQFKNISLIDLEENKYYPSGQIIQSKEINTRAENDVEPGLKAINVRPLWDMGYTGRGRLVYNYDTGVFPTHPCFSNRFLANNYPLNQCWFPYKNEIPTGIISSHGTHTLGTIAGLDKKRNDTIGVAFNSYWIANDYVASTVEELPPISGMIEAFEWALNPDGNINTTSDIPDVINNSWRWYDGNDTLHCEGFVVNLMNAIEAVGIANVFSGGNSGPNNSTVNSPQRISTSEVNTFCVGAVNGNSNFPYSIANFSTRGPKQCTNNHLKIHPEVVAPGVNVRSAWGISDYNSISGTSMSAPHVSGGILLLKEAFPNVSGEEILRAIYETAIDLGENGEDNIYGNGMVDFHAAFLKLSQNHTPKNPNNINQDLEIKLNSPDRNSFICNNELKISLTLKNLGTESLNYAKFKYKINDDIYTFNWNGNLTTQQSTIINLPTYEMTTFGEKQIQIDTDSSNFSNDYDKHNNHIHFSINYLKSLNFPFIERFEKGILADKWIIKNDDNAITWDTISTLSRHGTKSAYMNLGEYSPRDYQVDLLTTKLISLPNVNKIKLAYDFAYQNYHTTSLYQDSFKVLISNDCGNTFTSLKETFANEMSTIGESSLENDFIPTKLVHWRRDSLDISNYSNSDVMIRFITRNSQGNNLYIDNVSIYSNDDPLNTNKYYLKKMFIHPNPSKNSIHIISPTEENTRINIMDINGKIVKRIILDKNNSIDIKQLNSGIYFIESTGFKVTKFIKY